jgi:hypothetical protein
MAHPASNAAAPVAVDGPYVECDSNAAEATTSAAQDTAQCQQSTQRMLLCYGSAVMRT